MKFISRFALTTSTGAFQLWQQETLLWTREESLASIQAATFADFPLNADAEVVVPEPLKATTAEDTKVTPTLFLLRSICYDVNVPFFIQLFNAPKAPKSFINTVQNLLNVTYHAVVQTGPANVAWRNKLGFRKMIIAATSYGKILALDSTAGEVLWGQILSMTDASGMPVDAKMKVFLLKSASKESKLRVGVVVSTGSATVSPILRDELQFDGC